MTNLNEQDKPETRATVAGRLHVFVMCCICGDEIISDGHGDGECCDDCLNYDELEGLLEAAL